MFNRFQSWAEAVRHEHKEEEVAHFEQQKAKENEEGLGSQDPLSQLTYFHEASPLKGSVISQ